MRAPLALALLLPTSASAAWPEDVDLSGMLEHEGVTVVDTAALQQDYETVVRQLGSLVAARVHPQAKTLGAAGFEVVFDLGIGFPSTPALVDDNAEDDNTPAWERVHVAEDPGVLLVQPGITLRKGLPLGLELGASARWMANTRQGVFSGFLRAGIVEDLEPWPDIGVHLGYSGYVGNDELELGATDLGLQIGKEFAFAGAKGGPKTATFAPWVDATVVIVTATPLIDTATAARIGASTFGTRGRPEIGQQPAFTTGQFQGGFEVGVGAFVGRLSGGYTLRGAAHVGAALGFQY